MSLNRWVFKWRLKVRMFSHSRMSAGRKFQVDGAATEKARRASSVCSLCKEPLAFRQSGTWSTLADYAPSFPALERPCSVDVLLDIFSRGRNVQDGNCPVGETTSGCGHSVMSLSVSKYSVICRGPSDT